MGKLVESCAAMFRSGKFPSFPSAAYVLGPGQLDRTKQGAARAGRTVLNLKASGVIDPGGRTEEYNRPRHLRARKEPSSPTANSRPFVAPNSPAPFVRAGTQISKLDQG
jgi:hypothetical protein